MALPGAPCLRVRESVMLHHQMLPLCFGLLTPKAKNPTIPPSELGSWEIGGGLDDCKTFSSEEAPQPPPPKEPAMPPRGEELV